MTALSAARTAFTRRREQPWVKLCGVRDVDTAHRLAALRPDAIGLNFFEPSVRYVSPPIAADICRNLPADVLAVGVFVNASADEIRSVIDVCGLAAVQLHGDEPATLVAQLRRARPELAILKAFRVGTEGLTALADSLAEHAEQDATPDAILVDASVSGAYGGTGQTAPWHLIRNSDLSWPPLILAGGLVPENIAEAIVTVRPFGVDTAGGVESSPGVKDATRAAAFIAAARAAHR